MIVTAVASLDDYTIEYIHSQMTKQLPMYTMYTVAYTLMYTIVTLCTL